ncbi:MAG: Quinolone resistance protein, major facilitator family transporter [Firmicutes bacterium]|nr:Quinolone resistance protein, major facilitator family transporter [Bacillota bacterium]
MTEKIEKETNLLNKQYVLSCFVNFTAMLVHYACLINFPVFILDVLKRDASIAGLITTAYIFAAMLLRPIGAPILSKIGTRFSVLVGLGIVFISAVGYTFGATMITLLFAARILNGFGFGLQQTALNTAVVDFIPATRKGEGLGNFSMFMNIGSAIAPMLSLGIVKAYGYTILFEGCMGLSLIAIAGAYYLRPHELTKKAAPAQEKRLFSLRDYFEPKAFPVAIFGAFIFAFCYTVINTFFAAYARTIPSVVSYIGFFFMAISAVLVVVRPFIGRVMDKKGEQYIMYPGFVVLALGMFLISRMDSVPMMFLAAACLGMGYSAIFAGAQSSCIKAASADRVGQANVTFFFFFDLGFSLGAFCFGLVAKSIGFSNMYLADSVLYLIGFALYFLFVGRNLARARSTKTTNSTSAA